MADRSGGRLTPGQSLLLRLAVLVPIYFFMFRWVLPPRKSLKNAEF